MIGDTHKYLSDLASLHDASLWEICWNAKGATLRLEFDDYRAGISENDDPKYNASVEFAGVSGFESGTNNAQSMAGDVPTVSALEIVAEKVGWRATLVMNSGAMLAWNFLAINVQERAA